MPSMPSILLTQEPYAANIQHKCCKQRSSTALVLSPSKCGKMVRNFVQGAATASAAGSSRNPWLLAGLSRTKKGACDCAQPKEKRKVGRPIAYCGDPNSPDLTPSERRRILRRIANRESARRVRARRLDLLDDMAQKVCPLRMPCACQGLSSALRESRNSASGGARLQCQGSRDSECIM